MRRTILTLALTAGMVLGGASVALAHPPDSNPGQANGFLGDGPLGAFDKANENGATNGIAKSYVVRSPNCLLHTEFH